LCPYTTLFRSLFLCGVVAESVGLHPAAGRPQRPYNLLRPGTGDNKGPADRRRVQPPPVTGMPAAAQQQVYIQPVLVLQGQQGVSRQGQSVDPVGEIPKRFLDGNDGSPGASCAGCYCTACSATMWV